MKIVIKIFVVIFSAVFCSFAVADMIDGTPPSLFSTKLLRVAPNIQARQSILSGAVNSAGSSGFANAGTGLNVNLTATATPLTFTFAAGFNATSGAIDYIGQEVADVTSFWASLPANQYSFLSIDRNVSTGALTATQTLMRPQRGPTFYSPRQALLHFENNATDDWNNAWNPVGAGISYTAPCAKFGSFGLSITGTSSYVQSISIFNPGQSNWTMDEWVNLSSNASANLMSVGSSYGVFVATDAGGHLNLYLSSGGASWDIANGTAGSTVMTASAFHHIALTYDGINYRLFLDGVIQVTVASTTVVWPDGVAMGVGAQVGVGSGTAGCYDEFDFVPYARWVANFTPPLSAYTVAGDWFDTNAMVMKTATAAGPIWTTIQRLYVGEAQTGAASVSAVYNYSVPAATKGADFALDPAFGKLRVGNDVIYSGGTPQFISSSTPGTPCTTVPSCTIGSPVTWLLNGPTSLLSSAQQVPPDAKWFYVQLTVAHAPINSGNYQDCTFTSRIPVGTIQNYAPMWAAYANYAGMGTATGTTSFMEGAGPVLRFPVLNGVAAFETEISGPTCNTGGSSNQARLVSGILVGYEMP